MSVDPLAETAPDKTPYHYVSNNPINRIDPKGLTDYGFNKKTGEVKQIGDKDNSPDRMLKMRKDGSIKKYGDGIFGFLVSKDRRGKSKVAIENVADGILEDGQNFKTDGALIALGSNEDGPGKKGIYEFMLDLSEYVNKEIGATLFSNKKMSNEGDMTHKL